MSSMQIEYATVIHTDRFRDAGHYRPVKKALAGLSEHKEMKMSEKEITFQRAKKRVEALKGFYIHLSVFVLVNLFLFLLNISISSASFWFYWPLLGWGIAIVVHALPVLWGFDRPFGTEWEEKKIEEIMEKE